MAEGFNVIVPQECPECKSEEIVLCVRPNANMVYAVCRDCGWQSKGLPHVDKPRGRRRPSVAVWADKVKTRDRYMCRICGRKGDLEAHHIIPVKNDINGLYTLDVNNGITLCKTCHQLVHK